MTMRSAARALLLLLPLVCAEKDDSYYPRGIQNSNVQRSHYWHDANNVLDDLSQFDKLYVKFHNCAWSPMEAASGNGDRNNGYCPGDASNNGGDGEESDSWYLGAGPCYRANVGFTLYGVLKGQRDTGCRRGTYINSMVTTSGIDSFLVSLYSAGATDLYPYIQQGDNQQQQQSFSAPSSYCAVGNTLSYTTGCQDDQFVIQGFSGAYCNSRQLMEAEVDTLEDFNAALDDTGCVAIYETNGLVTQSNGDNNNNSINPISILRNSRSCSPHEASCPDPYGLLVTYANRVEHAVGVQPANASALESHNATSWTILGLGIAFMVSAVLRLKNPSKARRKYLMLGCKRCYRIRVSYLATYSRSTDENDDDESCGSASTMGRSRFGRFWKRNDGRYLRRDETSVASGKDEDATAASGVDKDDDMSVASLGTVSTLLTKGIERGSDPPPTRWFRY